MILHVATNDTNYSLDKKAEVLGEDYRAPVVIIFTANLWEGEAETS